MNVQIQARLEKLGADSAEGLAFNTKTDARTADLAIKALLDEYIRSGITRFGDEVKEKLGVLEDEESTELVNTIIQEALANLHFDVDDLAIGLSDVKSAPRKAPYFGPNNIGNPTLHPQPARHEPYWKFEQRNKAERVECHARHYIREGMERENAFQLADSVVQGRIDALRERHELLYVNPPHRRNW